VNKTNSIWGVVCFGAFSFFSSVYSQVAPPARQPGAVPAIGEGIPTITNVPILPGQGAGDIGLGTADIPARPELVRPDSIQVKTNEFQLFIERSTGQALPMFGRNLFQGADGGFAPAVNIPVTADYVVGPGDELIIRAWGQIDINLRLIVDRNGAINVPRVGVLQVAGLKANQLEGFVKAQVGRVFKNFEMNVTFGRLRSIKVLVVGHAQRPGNYTVSSLSTLLSTLFAAGGPSSVGSMRRIVLRRNNQIVSEMDLYDLLLKGENANDQRLLNGDIIHVLPSGPMVALSGSVQLPAIYELKGDEKIGDVVGFAGGLSAVGNAKEITVERISDQATRQVKRLSLPGNGLSEPARNGDLIHVRQISPAFEKVVTLQGHVAYPKRATWSEGMRVRDLMPNENDLIPEAFWLQKNDLINKEGRIDKEVAKSPIELTRGLLQNINWKYATITRLDKQTLKNELIVFNLGDAIKDNEPDHNRLLKPGDVVTIYNQQDIRVPKKMKDVLVVIEGEVENPGVHPIMPGETLARLIERLGGFTSDAYPYASVFTREAIRRSEQEKQDAIIKRLEDSLLASSARLQAKASTGEEAQQVQMQIQARKERLEKLKETPAVGRLSLEIGLDAANHRDLPNIVLEDGDRLVVPPKQNAIFVIGEVYNRNTLTHYENLSVNDYITKSGGVTRNADEKYIYVIKANGVVMARSGRWWSRSPIVKNTLNPGDMIVVPENLEPTTFKKELKDWSQILSNFALGVAALKVLGD